MSIDNEAERRLIRGWRWSRVEKKNLGHGPAKTPQPVMQPWGWPVSHAIVAKKNHPLSFRKFCLLRPVADRFLRTVPRAVASLILGTTKHCTIYLGAVKRQAMVRCDGKRLPAVLSSNRHSSGGLLS